MHSGETQKSKEEKGKQVREAHYCHTELNNDNRGLEMKIMCVPSSLIIKKYRFNSFSFFGRWIHSFQHWELDKREIR